jgi:hypothetical protein
MAPLQLHALLPVICVLQHEPLLAAPARASGHAVEEARRIFRPLPAQLVAVRPINPLLCMRRTDLETPV